jgi:hypothetical protein
VGIASVGVQIVLLGSKKCLRPAAVPVWAQKSSRRPIRSVAWDSLRASPTYAQ